MAWLDKYVCTLSNPGLWREKNRVKFYLVLILTPFGTIYCHTLVQVEVEAEGLDLGLG